MMDRLEKVRGECGDNSRVSLLHLRESDEAHMGKNNFYFSHNKKERKEKEIKGKPDLAAL